MKRNTQLLPVFSIFISTLLFISCSTDKQSDSGWDQVPEIMKRIVPPTFPDRDFLVTDFGATNDGMADCTDAFKKAILACHEAGGGRVVVPEGIYLTGSIHLLSNVNLHISGNATIRFSTDSAQYLPAVHTRFEGIELMNFSPLIYAFEQENIAITGSGTLDGQAGNDHWWPWVGVTSRGWKQGMPSQRDNQPTLYRMAAENVPVAERIFPEGSYFRPPFVQPFRCKNILIDSVTLINGPFWMVTPDLCENVTVRNITVRSHGPNNDGCNPESCKDVLIENCYFDTGDDCIAIKSGKNEDGRRINVPSENIIIRNCRMKDGHGGVVIGSEISGGIRNIFAEKCVMDSPNLDCGLRIKTNSMRGGFAENIYFRDIQIGEVGDVVRVNYYYSEGDAGEFTPHVRNIQVENVTSRKSIHGLNLMGYPRSPITDIYISHCRFENAENGNHLINVNRVVADDVIINGKEFKTVMDDMVPETVLSALEQYKDKGHVRRVNKRIEDDRIIYEFQLMKGWEFTTVTIRNDGRVM